MGITVLISGAEGLIGSALRTHLTGAGHRVIALSRRGAASAERILWNPELDQFSIRSELKLDAVVHLSGEPIASGRWTQEKKRRIRESRVRGTSLLVDALARSTPPPPTFLCASAVGIYGDRGDEELSEHSSAGKNFLAQVGLEWESAAQAYAKLTAARVCCLRFGVVLSPQGGALKKMLPAFKLGLGGRLGNGRQWFSWITLEDAVKAIVHVLHTNTLHGPVNIVSPTPVRNAEFTRYLAKASHRPAFIPVPAMLLRLLFGELADEALLSSQRVVPKVLLESGFEFGVGRLENMFR